MADRRYLLSPELIQKTIKQSFVEHNFYVGYHDCARSILQVCVYDPESDYHDRCIFCGDPQERK